MSLIESSKMSSTSTSQMYLNIVVRIVTHQR